MNWINNVVRPKISGLLSTAKRDVPDNLWVKCPDSGQMVFYKDLEANQFVVPGSNYHMRMDAQQRLQPSFRWRRIQDRRGADRAAGSAEVPRRTQIYRSSERRQGGDEARGCRSRRRGQLDGQPIVSAVQDFRFMAGSLGMAAVKRSLPACCAPLNSRRRSFSSRPRAARACRRASSPSCRCRDDDRRSTPQQARLPYIVVLTDPTTGGVTASYAMLGDIHIAEPGALICFAGPRVIQQTIREQLPDGFQRAEYLLSHGMVDMVVHRHQLRETLSRVCKLLMSGAQVTKPKDTRKMNGKPYVNGASVDSKVMETAARETGGVVEPEVVPNSQRFEPGKGDKKRDDAATPSAGSKDAPQGA